MLDVKTPEDSDIYGSVNETSQDEELDQNTLEVEIKQTSPDDEIKTSKDHRVLRAGNKRGSDLVDLHDNVPENRWCLPDQLAAIFNKNATKLLSFSKIKENITDHHLIAENVVKKREWMIGFATHEPEPFIRGERQTNQKR